MVVAAAVVARGREEGLALQQHACLGAKVQQEPPPSATYNGLVTLTAGLHIGL